MSYQRDRDDFFAHMIKAGMGADTIRLLLRHANTIQRLAVAQCNGDYPYDNGQRRTVECDGCGSGTAPDALKRYKGIDPEQGDGHAPRKYCPDCRTTARIKALVAGSGFMAECSGDPRGWCVKLYTADSTREDRDSGRARSIGVPARNY